MDPTFTGEQYFIGIKSMEPVQISGCTFENNLVINDPTFRQRGYGIVCSAGDVVVSDWEPRNIIPDSTGTQTVFGIPSKFKNLQYGICGITTGENTIIITGSNFEDNLRGVYLSGYQGQAYAKIIYSSFKTLDPILMYGPAIEANESYGLYLNNCTGYTIEENEFYNHSDIGPLGIGLIINQSGPYANEVYNNKFHGLDYAALPQNSNRNDDDTLGLCFICNDFSHNNNDITVTSNYPTWNFNQGIATYQGNGTVAASNTFTTENDNSPIYFDIYNPPEQFSPINYYTKDELNGFNIIPKKVSEKGVNVISEVPGHFEKNTDCPSHLIGTKSIDELLSEKQEAKMQRNIIQTFLHGIIDGGSTEELVNQINFSFPDDAVQITNELLTKSPFLSDSVMKIAASRENVLTNSMIRDIFVENPQSAKSVQIMDLIDQRVLPMPDSMIKQIELGETILGAKENMEAILSQWNQKYAETVKYLICQYNEDTTGIYGTDSVIALLNHDNSLQSNYSLAYLYYKIGQYTSGNAILKAIPNNFNLSEKEVIEQERFSELFPIFQKMKTTDDTLDSIQIETLRNLALNDGDFPGASARNLLLINNKMQYTEPIILPSLLKQSKKRHLNDPSNADYKEYWLKVYPNPAKTYFIVEYRTIKNQSPIDVTISIVDINGHEIMQFNPTRNFDQVTIATDALSSGQYFVLLKKNSKTIDRAKATVIK